MIDAGLEHHLRRPGAGAEVEIGDAEVAGERAVEEQIGGEGRIEQARAVREPQLFVDVCLHGGAAGERRRHAAFDAQRGHRASSRQNDRRIEDEVAFDQRRRAGRRRRHAAQHIARHRQRRCGQAGRFVGVDERVRAAARHRNGDFPVNADVGHTDQDAPFIALRVVTHRGEVLRRRRDLGGGNVERDLRAGERHRRVGAVDGDLRRGDRRPAERQQTGERLRADGGESDPGAVGDHAARNGEIDLLRHRRVAAVRHGDGQAVGRRRIAALGQTDVDGHHAGAGGNDDLAPHAGVSAERCLDGVRALGEAGDVAAARVGRRGDRRLRRHFDGDRRAGQRASGRGVVHLAGDEAGAIAGGRRLIAAHGEALAIRSDEMIANAVLDGRGDGERERLRRKILGGGDGGEVVGHGGGTGDGASVLEREKDRIARSDRR